MNATDQPAKAVPISLKADFTGFMTIIVGLSILRLIILMVTPLNLGLDETQYWYWAQTPSFGYYSKPPLIAWAIAATTTMFGNVEWATRLPALLFHMGTATFIFLTARHLYDERAGFWAGITWILLPGVGLSSTLIATDAPMLFFFSAGLFLLLRRVPKGSLSGQSVSRASTSRDKHASIQEAALLGMVVGLGMMSKYAMVYFIIGLGLAYLLSPMIRRVWKPWHLAIMGVSAGIVMLPNILWNAQNDFQTLSHTADNADWNGTFGHPVELAAFIGGQFGVAGPIIFAMAIAAGLASVNTAKGRLLLAFILPALIIVSIQAFLSRAHANWAAASYPAAIVLISGWALTNTKENWLKAGNGLNGAALLVFMVALINPAIAHSIGLARPVSSLQGWDHHGEDVAKLAAQYDVVMSDDRDVIGGLLYYARRVDPTVIAWDSNNRIDHHYEAFFPFDPATHKRILFVSESPEAAEVKGAFRQIIPLGTTRAKIEGGAPRELYLFSLEGFIRK
ncbi:MAG: glycosyltransferase family 39 protein [Pseudomonadota bacterium]